MPKPQMAAPPEITPSGAAPGEEFSHTPIGFSVGTDYYNTGKMGANWGTGIPLPVTAELMQRGEQRFNITCSVCHGLTAAGNGIAKQYGLSTVATLQDDRIRKMADGEIFNTITNGKNTMMSYGGNVPVADRWAIIAYVRALQRSQNAAAADVPREELAKLEKAEAKPPEPKPATSPEAPKK
jgi:mono/diheme cytochrome c family protein